MVFKNSIPLPGDNLSDSQLDLKNNNAQLDTSFAVDHFPFSDLTSNNGKHNVVTTPAYTENPPTGAPPVTGATEPRFYAFQQYAPIGVIQYSRGVNNAIPTPLTTLQSPVAGIAVAAGGTTDVIDFAGMNRVMAKLYTYTTDDPFTTPFLNDAECFVTFELAFPLPNIQICNRVPVAPLSVFPLLPQAAGTILQLKNNTNPGAPILVYWTLQFLRIQ